MSGARPNRNLAARQLAVRYSRFLLLAAALAMLLAPHAAIAGGCKGPAGGGGASTGVTALLIRNTAKGKTKVRIKAAGDHLPMPTPASKSRLLHKDGNVIAQLVNSTGTCWTSTFATARTNSTASFVARAGATHQLVAK